jgi:hypothetical protein
MAPTGNVIPPLLPRPWADDADREGTTHGLCSPGYHPTARRSESGLCPQVRHRDCRVRAVPTSAPPMIYAIGTRRQANPIRLSVARELGRDIDGAWWPRADRITNELPNLVAVLTPLLGDITSINVNWSPLQRPPDLNWPGWEGKRQHVMTLSGTHACANLLIISFATHGALALMVLRCAANLPIEAADRDKRPFSIAGSILRAALQQRASGLSLIPTDTDDCPAGPAACLPRSRCTAQHT